MDLAALRTTSTTVRSPSPQFLPQYLEAATLTPTPGLCSSTSTPLLDNLLYCVRTACDTTTDPALLTDPLQSIQTACKQTAHTIPDTAAASASAAAHDAVLDQELKRRNVLAARTSMGAGPASTPANSIPTAGGAVTGTDGAPMATYTPTDAMPSYYISTTDTALTSSSTQKNSASSGGSDAGTLLDMSSGSASKNAKGLLRLTVGVLVCMIAWF